MGGSVRGPRGWWRGSGEESELDARRAAGGRAVTAVACHPGGYAVCFFNRARWASNSSRSAMPTRYQQTISYVRRVGFWPVHRLISMQAMIAQYAWISIPFG